MQINYYLFLLCNNMHILINILKLITKWIIWAQQEISINIMTYAPPLRGGEERASFSRPFGEKGQDGKRFLPAPSPQRGFLLPLPEGEGRERKHLLLIIIMWVTNIY